MENTTKDGTAQAEQTVWIDVNLIDIPQRFREHSQEAIDDLAQEIRDQKQLQEIIVTPKEGGRYELLAGKRRTLAIRKLGWERIRAQVMEGVSELEKIMIMIAENEDRKDVSPIDKAFSYKGAIDTGKISQQELAIRRGVSEPVMSSYLALTRLPANVLAEFRRRNLSMGQLDELMRLKQEDQQLKLAEECETKGLPVKALRARVEQTLKAGDQDAGSPAPATKNSQPAGFQFAWKGKDLVVKGRLSVESGGPEIYVQAFQAALLQFLEQNPLTPGSEAPEAKPETMASSPQAEQAVPLQNQLAAPTAQGPTDLSVA